MNNKFSKYIVLSVAVLSISSLSLRTASAASSIDNDVNSIDSKVNQLITIRDDSSLSSADKTAQEFKAQQDVLNSVIDLSDNEISSLQDKLNNLPKFDADSPEKQLQDTYSSELDGYATYFGDERQQVADASTIDDLKSIATDIKDYRSSGYNDEIQNIITFTLVYYDESVISTAKTRLDKVTSDINKLQSSGLLKKSFSHSSLDKASGLIDEATKLEDQAKALILQPPQDNTPATQTGQTTTDKTVTPPPAPRDLINQSINDIKESYNLFIQVSKDIRKALGLS